MDKPIPCELITWAEIGRLAARLAAMIRDSGFVPDTIVAIGRGGYVPARLLCDYLDINALTSIRAEHYQGPRIQDRAIISYPLCADIAGQQVLLVDDVNDSGDTLALAIEHLRSRNAGEVRVAVLHHKTVSHFCVDYYAKKVVKWRWLAYPWARKEDLSHFIGKLSPPPADLQQARQRLAEVHGLTVSENELRQFSPFMTPRLDSEPS